MARGHMLNLHWTELVSIKKAVYYLLAKDAKKIGGKIIALAKVGGNLTVFENDINQNTILIKFDSYVEVINDYKSSDYQKVLLVLDNGLMEISEFLKVFNKYLKEWIKMRFAKGLETWVKNRLPNLLRDRLNNNKYRFIIKKEKPLDLIVHVGAHYAEDRFFYEELGAREVLWIEADPNTYSILKSTLESHQKNNTVHKLECALVSSHNDNVYEFNRFNGDGASSSIYNAGKIHKERFSEVRETGEKIKLKSKTLKTIMRSHDIKFDQISKSMLVVDVQGHELSVLKGAKDLIANFDFLKCEVSRVEMYKGGTKFVDLDNFLKNNQFRLTSHQYWRVPNHGDVLYSKL